MQYCRFKRFCWSLNASPLNPTMARLVVLQRPYRDEDKEPTQAGNGDVDAQQPINVGEPPQAKENVTDSVTADGPLSTDIIDVASTST